MKFIAVAVLCVLSAFQAVAQTADQAPAYFTGMGVGFSRAASANPTLGIVFGMRAANTSGTWATLEFDNATGQTSTAQVGIMQDLATRGGWKLFALGQAGGATDPNGAIAAVFGGGGGMGYSLGKLWSKLDGLTTTGIVKAQKVNGSEVVLAYSFWLTKSF
jgi:hypothetical protein